MYDLRVTPVGVECAHADTVYAQANPFQVAAMMIRAGVPDGPFRLHINDREYEEGDSLLVLACPLLVGHGDEPPTVTLIPVPSTYRGQALLSADGRRLSRTLRQWCNTHLSAGWSVELHSMRHIHPTSSDPAALPDHDVMVQAHVRVVEIDDVARFRDRWFDADNRRRLETIIHEVPHANLAPVETVDVVATWDLSDRDNRCDEGLVVLLRNDGLVCFRFSQRWVTVAEVSLCVVHFSQLTQMILSIFGNPDEDYAIASCEGNGTLDLGLCQDSQSPEVAISVIDRTRTSNPQALIAVARGRLLMMLDEIGAVLADLLATDDDMEAEAEAEDIPLPPLSVPGNSYRH